MMAVFFLFFFVFALHYLLSLFNIRNSFYQPLRTGLNYLSKHEKPYLLSPTLSFVFLVQLSSTTLFEYHGLPACGHFWSFKILISLSSAYLLSSFLYTIPFLLYYLSYPRLSTVLLVSLHLEASRLTQSKALLFPQSWSNCYVHKGGSGG